MAILDAKKPATQATSAPVSVTKAEALSLEGKVPLVVDGVAGLPPGRRLLFKNQTSEAQNGLWEVSKNEAFATEGTFGVSGKFGAGETWVLKRPTDADSSEEVTEGMLVPVEDGIINQQTSWIQRTANPIEVGTTAQTFEPLIAGARGTAGGDLQGTYSAPSVREAVIDNTKVHAAAGIEASKLELTAKIEISDLAASAKEAFLQLAKSSGHKLAFGSEIVTFGATNLSGASEIEHGLGTEPINVHVDAVPTGNGFIVMPYLVTVSKTKLSFGAFAPQGAPGSGQKALVYWYAIS